MECEHGAHCVAGVCVCPEVCPENGGGELVCGSDAKTYQSECELQRAACGRDPKLPALHVIFYGDCGERLAVAALSMFLKLYLLPIPLCRARESRGRIASPQLKIAIQRERGENGENAEGGSLLLRAYIISRF